MSITHRTFFSITDRKKIFIFSILFLLLFIFTQIPLWRTTVLPLVDYPNHLARMHILANIDHSDGLQKYYQVRWAVLPNLAMDVIVPPLSKIIGLDRAAKVFVGIIFFYCPAGPLRCIMRFIDGFHSGLFFLSFFYTTDLFYGDF